MSSTRQSSQDSSCENNDHAGPHAQRTVQEWFTAAVVAAGRAGSKTPEADVNASLAGALCWNLDHGDGAMTRDQVIAALRGYIAGCSERPGAHLLPFENVELSGSPCRACLGIGRNPLSDNSNWLPCAACGGKGLSRVR